MSFSVLIVEDDPKIAEIHRHFTEKVDGFEVVGIADSLADAEKMSRLLEPDLVLLDDDEQAARWSRQLAGEGILVTAIRPPTVPEGSARLRVTLSAAHRDEQLTRLLDALARLPRELP